MSFFTFSGTGFPYIPDNTDIVVIPVEKIHMLDMKLLMMKNVPVLAYGGLHQLRKAFLSGCRDYIRLPVTRDELYFRILQNVSEQSRSYTWGNLTAACGYIREGNQKVPLTYHQFLILRLLLVHRNEPVPRQSFQYILRGNVKPRSRDIDMHIVALRRKLIQLNSENTIKTVTGLGYMIEDQYCG